MARGMVLEALPACPERCGGQGCDVSRLPEEKRRHRTRFGCDAPIPEGAPAWYAIRCPRCDGAAANGEDCALCGGGSMPGFKIMRRCPAHYLTSDISAALVALKWTRDGFLPGDGSLGDQAISFIEFRALLEAEIGEAQREQKQEGS